MALRSYSDYSGPESRPQGGLQLRAYRIGQLVDARRRPAGRVCSDGNAGNSRSSDDQGGPNRRNSRCARVESGDRATAGYPGPIHATHRLAGDLPSDN